MPTLLRVRNMLGFTSNFVCNPALKLVEGNRYPSQTSVLTTQRSVVLKADLGVFLTSAYYRSFMSLCM